MLKKIILFCFFAGFLLVLAGGIFLTWGYFYITRDLPRLTTIEDYRPPAVSFVYAKDGTVVGEFYKERRYPAKMNEIPVLVRNAFIAAEDAAFYEHGGIDFISILRALYKNFEQGEAKQGASTITQQVVKNLLLTPEKKLKRKAKEAILSFQIEKRFTKDEILVIYLNQIFFGNTAYGIKAASRLYFHKDPIDMTLAEAALLAGLPKAPSKYSPILNPDRAKRRQRYVLKQMEKVGFITAEQSEAANREKVVVYGASAQNIFDAPSYVSEVRRILTDRWKNLDIDADGLQIYTALDLDAHKIAIKSLRKGLEEVDKRRGWRGPIASIPGAQKERFVETYGIQALDAVEAEAIYPGLVTAVSSARGSASVFLGKDTVEVNVREVGWARKKLDKEEHVQFIKPEEAVKAGDIIEISAQRIKKAGSENETTWQWQLDQTPEIEGAVVLADPYSGEVSTIEGGYSYQRSQFNRATQSYRQPGSTFKPVVYLSAVDGFKYTPATIVYDSPRTFRVGDQFWTPGNFDGKYMGPITLRTALEKSRNLVSADIVSRIGVDAVIDYARKLGIESHLGRNLSIALGSSEVTLLELTRAYGVFAAKGVLFGSTFITKIVDRDGQVLFDYEQEKLNSAHQVISEDAAFVMANLMRGVVEHGTGYRVKELGRPAAGKTGTSNEEMDTWFIGYTPQWVCGVWVGFDQKKRIGEKETGGRVAAPIWLYLMRDFLNAQDTKNYNKLVEDTKAQATQLGIEYTAPEPLSPLDFTPTEGVDPYWIDKESGYQVEAGSPGAFLEYFIKGSEPNQGTDEMPTTESYLDSPEL